MKHNSIRLLLILLMSVVCAKTFAHDIAVANGDVWIYYDWVDNNGITELRVSCRGDSYSSYSNEYTGNVVIPSSVTYQENTYSVTSIGKYAFYGCRGLTSVTIPNSVTFIGEDAFYGCRGLTSVTIPNSVTFIGREAFEGCSGLTSVTIPNSVTSIGARAFYDCSGLTSVTIPNSVTSIGDYAFSNCSGLPLEDGLRYADTYLVGAADANITKAIIKEGTKWIGSTAFKYCRGLTSIDIPNSVTSIGAEAFFRSGLTSVTIPNSVTFIGRDAFYDCRGLTSITIPNSVTSIGNDAFSNCSSLASVTIPYSVTSIGARAFCDCSGLTSVTIPNSVTSIGSSAFYGCSGLTSVTIPNSVTCIGEYAFYGCSGLTSVTIPNSVTSIGSSAFYGCSSLTSVTIPNSVTSIGFSAFYGCSGLPVEDGLRYADTYLVGAADKNITKAIIKEGTKWIGDIAFNGCSGLTSVTIPNSVTSIGSSAFYGCSGLTSVTIPNSVTSIGARAFYDCSGLTSVTIPNKVTSIGDYAFYNCSGLTSITIPNRLTSIGSGAFGLCCNLKYVRINSSVPIVIESGCMSFNEDRTLLVPCGSVPLYSNAPVWRDFDRIIENGDIDLSKEINTSDVTALYNVIFGTAATTAPFIGDIDGSGGLPNTTDITALYNIIFGTASTEPSDPYLPLPNDGVITVNGVSFKMVKVDGGTFQMGATSEEGSAAYDNEKPAHSVTLSDYWIGETEVTQALWQAVMGSNPSYFSGNQRPVETVNWYYCETFISRLWQLTGYRFRLPSEAEWEFAARGGNMATSQTKYAGSDNIGDVAWYYDNSYAKGNSSPDYGTHDVATKAPNELGIYDMSGNVYEWCQDWYGSYSSGSQTNPTGPYSGSRRVLRGGCWGGSARDCRVSYRHYDDPSFSSYTGVGFRIAF